jgi:hypothetical protein
MEVSGGKIKIRSVQRGMAGIPAFRGIQKLKERGGA